ncbi:MAG: DUF6046 domain-containing protein [Alistipes senegalensis]|nr:DUF6046 domain-containing protein [Bacteroides cellulosilyticus]MCM1351341.1 DUF6046 domain-containing protein [Alistipes senegalensis]
MAKVEYELNRIAPQANAGYGGNPFDPAQVATDKALGRYGAVPPFFIPKKEDIVTQVYDADEIMADYSAVGIIHSVMPMKFKRPDDKEWFCLPLEPLVSVSGKNIIVRRKVAKSKLNGTIKERWSQDDYEVTIQGVVSGSDESKYPDNYLRKLIELFDERQAVEVEQGILQVFGIRYLAIESASFPHTKGMNNQHYEIKAYSDNPVEFLISI